MHSPDEPLELDTIDESLVPVEHGLGESFSEFSNIEGHLNQLKPNGYQLDLLDNLEHTRAQFPLHQAHLRANQPYERPVTQEKFAQALRAIAPETWGLKGLAISATIISAISCKVYWEVAFKAPANSDAMRWVNRLSSVFTNLVLGGYFLYQPIADNIRNNRLAPEVRQSSMRMRIDNPGINAYRNMQLVMWGIMLAKIFAATPGSLAISIVDYFVAHDPIFNSIILFLVVTGMSYSGTIGIGELANAALPINWLRRRFFCRSPTNSLNYDLDVLRSALLTNLNNIEESLLFDLQKKRHTTFHRLYSTMNQTYKNPRNANKLLLEILQTHTNPIQRNLWAKNTVQVLGATGTALANAGYYFSVVDGLQGVLGFSRTGSVICTTFLYSIPMALYVNVSRVIIGPIYDFLDNIVHCRGIRWPLAFVQNKKAMLLSLGLTLIFTAFSSGDARALNELFKDDIGAIKPLADFSSIIFVWLFNWYPCQEIIRNFQQSFQAEGKNQAYINQINLMNFIHSTHSEFNLMTRHFFLRYLLELSNQFVQENHGNQENADNLRETFFDVLFGYMKPGEVFRQYSHPSHPYFIRESWVGLIKDLVEREIDAQSTPSCSLFQFFYRRQTSEPIQANTPLVQSTNNTTTIMNVRGDFDDFDPHYSF